MRTRYADQPEKFMESEVDLDEEVKKLMAIAGTPELYPDLVRTNTIQTLLALLVHQNTDIVADVIGVFEDLTDADVIEDSVSCRFIIAVSAQHKLHLHKLAATLGLTSMHGPTQDNPVALTDVIAQQNPEKRHKLRWSCHCSA